MPIPIAPVLAAGGMLAPEILKQLGALGLPGLGELGAGMADVMQMPGDYTRGLLSGQGGRMTTNEFLQQLFGQPPSQPQTFGYNDFSRLQGVEPTLPPALQPRAGTQPYATEPTTPFGTPGMAERVHAPWPPQMPDVMPQQQGAPQDFGMLANFGVGLLTDPTNWIGGIAGGLAGSAASSRLGNLASRNALQGSIDELSRFGEAATLGQSLTGTVDDAAKLASAGFSGTPAYAAAEAANQSPMRSSLREMLGPFPGIGDAGPLPLHPISRVDPAAREMMLRTGLGLPGPKPGSVMVSLPERAMSAKPAGIATDTLPVGDLLSTKRINQDAAKLFETSRPPYLAGRGGTMFLRDPELAGLQRADILETGGRYDAPTNLSQMLGPSEFEYTSQFTGMPINFMDWDFEDADKVIADLVQQQLAKQASIPEPGPLIQALNRLGFR